MLAAPDIERLLKTREVVICDSELARDTHKELFRFNDDSYFTGTADDNMFAFILGIVDLCNSVQANFPSKIQLVLNWENLLRVSVWRVPKPTTGDVFVLLKSAGIGQDELQPFKNTDTNDLFPYLYYAKRFDILRKVCQAAKRQAEGRMKKHSVRVDSHIVSEDAKKIVASSL